MTEPTGGMRLELLSLRHRRALEVFERVNREFFALHIGDRGDDFFTRFDVHLAERVAENTSGRSLLCVVTDASGEIVARVNLLDIDQPEQTELGYRVAERAQGRGIATWGVTSALDLAVGRGVRRVHAKVATTNPASRRVLEHCGFALVGPTDPPAGSPKSFLGCRRDL